MDLFPLPRLGVVVPPENPTAEPEFHHLLGAGMNVYTARFPVLPGVGLREMLETYNEVLPQTLGGFGGMRLEAAVVACSASHYLLGPAADLEFCERLSARFGFPVRSSTQAILAACRAREVERLTLVSPYQPWLTETSRAFWQDAGLAVEEVVLVPAGRTPDGAEHYDPYLVDARGLGERLAPRLLDRRRGGGALLFTGTGMGTLATMEALAREEPALTLLSSNLACAWWALEAAGAQGRAVHPLLLRLAAAAAPQAA